MNENMDYTLNANESHFIKHSVGNIPGRVHLYSNCPGMKWTSIYKKDNIETKKPSFIIILLKEGTMKLNVKGVEETFLSGDFITLVKNCSYNATYLSDDFQYMAIELDESSISKVRDTLGISINLFQIENEERLVCKLDDLTMSYCENLFMTLWKWIFKIHHVYYSQIIQHLINLCIINVISLYNQDCINNFDDKKKILSRQNLIFEAA